MKTYWFNRLKKDLEKISTQIRLVRGRNGLNRIYYKNAYIHEVFEEMPQVGYDIEDYDPRFESQSYYEEYEDKDDLIRKIKNYKEGYWDAILRIKRRLWMLRTDDEFYNNSVDLYKNLIVK